MEGRMIKDIRKRLGLSQNGFANRLGVTWITVNRWENGVQKPSPLAIEKLIKAQMDAARIPAGR